MQKEFKKVKGAAYVSDAKINSRGNKITKPFTIGTSFIAIFVILFGVFFTTPNVNIQSGDAAFMGFLCNNETLGHNMKVTPNLHKLSVVPFMDATGRTWTLEEAYGGNLSFVNYYGETLDEPAGFLLADTDDLDKRAGFAHEEAIKTLEDNKDKLMAERTIAACTVDNLPLFIGTFLYMIASFIMNLITIFVTFAFDSGFICKKAEQSNCVDLVNVIGGSGSSTGGIIGTLTSNIYIPLAVIAIAIAAFSILYQGIVKRQFRQAFGYLAWILLAFIFGLMALLNPNLLARAPMVAANSIAGCIIGAFNGDNCFSSSSTDAQLDLSGANTSGAACKSAATGATDPADILSMSINSMACSIWKAFILQSQISAEFGVPFEELDVESETMKPLIEASGVPADTFCVGRYTAESYSEAQKTKPIQFTKNNSEICNLGVYQKYLQTNANSPGATAGFGVNPDPRWYNLMAVIIQDDEMWNTWNPDLGGGMTRLISGFVAIVSVIAGGIVLITISIYAMVYYISAIILMALAPLFLLFALQPTKGKKIFLGWVEKVISNLLKYLASAFFLLIALAFYSAVFGNLTNPMVTLIFIIILSIALFMYRKEITELIGRVNMGGEQFSNKFAGLADKSKKFAKVTAGSAIGAAVSTGGAKALVSKDAWAAAATGAGSGAMRELSRGSGVIGNAARQANRMRAQSTNEFKKEEAANLEEGKALEAAEENQKEVVANHQEEAEELKTQIEDKEKAAEELTGEIKTKAEGKVLHELKVDLESGKFEAGSSEENFAKFMLAAEAIKDLQAQRDQAHEDGDFDRAKDLTGEINTRMEEADGLKAQIPNDDFERLTDEFNNNVQNEVNVSMENNTELSSTLEQREVLNAQFNDAQDRVINAERDRIQISAQRVQNQATRDHLGKVNDRIRRGGTVGAATIKRAKKKAEKQSADGYDAYIADQSVSSQVFSDAYKAKAGANSTYTPNSDFETNAEDIMVGEKIGQETLRDANSGHQTKFKEQNREDFAKYATPEDPVAVPPITPSVGDKSGSGPNVLPSPPYEATSQQSVEDVHADNLRGNVNNSSTDTQPAQSPLARAAAANKPISNNDTSRNSDIDRDNPLQSVLNQEDTSTKETDREFAPIPVGTPKQSEGRERRGGLPHSPATRVDTQPKATSPAPAEPNPSQPAPQSSQTNRDVGDSRRSSSNSSPTPSPTDTTRREEPKPKKNTQATSSKEPQPQNSPDIHAENVKRGLIATRDEARDFAEGTRQGDRFERVFSDLDQISNNPSIDKNERNRRLSNLESQMQDLIDYGYQLPGSLQGKNNRLVEEIYGLIDEMKRF